MGVFDDITKTQIPNPKLEKPKTEGFVWVSMLIKYDLDGKASVIRSFAKPAKDSAIKSLYKKKYKPKGPVIKRKESDKEVKLF